MYCPQCGNESSDGLQYCRACGANLKVIGKAVALSEAIARSDRGPLPKIREMVKGLKVEHVTEEVSRALDRMNSEIVRISPEAKHPRRPWPSLRKKKTAEERREEQFVKGTVSFFSGIGLTVFLYYLFAAIVLKVPPDVVNKIPFELESVVRVIWLLGLAPALSGIGHIVAGLLIRPSPAPLISRPPIERETIDTSSARAKVPASITEHTTNLLSEEDLRETSERNARR
jgi:hypothetical protein